MMLRHAHGSVQSEWIQLSSRFPYRPCKLTGSMWPASNRDRRARIDGNGKRCLPPAAQNTDPLSIQVAAANDVNKINVCGHCLHTLILLTWCYGVRVEETFDTHSCTRLPNASWPALPVLTSIACLRRFGVQIHCRRRQSPS